MNSAAPRIERSTCVSAAKLTTASQPSPASATASASQMSPSTSRTSQPVEVRRVAGVGELVEHDHVLAGREQALDEVRADEAGAACDEDPHRPKASGRVRSATTGVRHRISSRGKVPRLEQYPASSAARHARRPSRQCGSSGAPSRSERSTEYAGRGAGRPSSAVVIGRTRQAMPGLLEDRLGELLPGALAVGGDVPERRARARGARASPRRDGRRRWGSRPGRRRPRPRPARAPSRSIVRTKLWPGRPEEPRRADDPARARPPRPRRAASSARRPRAGSARSDSTYGVRLRPSKT